MSYVTTHVRAGHWQDFCYMRANRKGTWQVRYRTHQYTLAGVWEQRTPGDMRATLSPNAQGEQQNVYTASQKGRGPACRWQHSIRREVEGPRLAIVTRIRQKGIQALYDGAILQFLSSREMPLTKRGLVWAHASASTRSMQRANKASDPFKLAVPIVIPTYSSCRSRRSLRSSHKGPCSTPQAWCKYVLPHA